MIDPAPNAPRPEPAPPAATAARGARPGLDLQTILADPQMSADLVSVGFRRYQASALYMTPYHDKWLRFFKLYRSIVDTVEDEDEPNAGVCYAYGVVEDLVSKISEPILQMATPCKPSAKRAGHEKSASNFESVARTYFRTSGHQLNYTDSIREMIICGNAWENDVWYNEHAEERVWDKVKKTGMTLVKSIFGAFLGQVPFEYEAMEERTVQTPVKVGYGCRYPGIFRIFPEPHVHDVRKMHWLCEEEPSAAIVDLEKRMISRNGAQVPFFNFDELRRDNVGKGGEIKPEPMSRQKSNAEDELRTVTGDQPEKDRTLNYADDIDRVSLLWVWEPHRVFVIAQGRYLVAYQEDVFQSPRIPYRLRRYTPQKDFLFGLGAIEPVEQQLYELTDIHRMSMRNWVRIINRMVAYNEEAIPYEDDFTPSALGRVRVRPTGGRSVAEEIVPISHTDVTPSMLQQESNVKGIVERTLSVADLSPGAEGTKQSHKTLGGLMQIVRNVAQRITTVQRMQLAAAQDQMWFMEKLHSQFMVEKAPFTVYGPDGSTAIQEFDLWDIATGGVGFDFVIEYDPSFGDDTVRLNQLMLLLGQSFSYIQQVKALGLRGVAMPNVEDIFRRILQKMGWTDTSEILPRPDGSLDPDQELQMMIEGTPTAPSPAENLSEHLAHHVAQEMMIAPLIKAGKINPRTALLLRAHIVATQRLMVMIASDPSPLAQKVVAEKTQAASQVPGLMPGGPGSAPTERPQQPIVPPGGFQAGMPS